MTVDGLYLGVIDDLVIDTDSGALIYILLDADGRDIGMFKTDAQGRVALPYKGIQSVRDVVVVSTE